MDAVILAYLVQILGRSTSNDYLASIVSSVLGVLSLYGDGSDGDSTIAASANISGGIYQYENLTIDANQTLSVTPSTGSLILFVNDTLTLGANAVISVKGAQNNGGNTSNGGAGICEVCGCGGSDGTRTGGGISARFLGYADYPTTGATSAGAAAADNFSIIDQIATVLWLAKNGKLYSAGGGGNGANSGGDGSSALIIFARNYVQGAGASLTASGNAGAGAAAAGGGGGSFVMLFSPGATATLTASGGSGFGGGYAGGAGTTLQIS